jgi:hypothetical protein
MKLKFLNSAITGLILSFSCLVNTANAGLILSNSTEVSTSGQNYSQLFDVSGFENYTDLVFTVNARGDYGVGLSESIEFFIDDISFGEFRYNSTGVTSVVGPTGNSAIDYIIDFSFNISDMDWNTLFANDSQVEVQWNNAFSVAGKDGYYVDFSLSGTPTSPTEPDAVPVPEPTTLAIFALGMIGFASRRFKK